MKKVIIVFAVLVTATLMARPPHGGRHGGPRYHHHCDGLRTAADIVSIVAKATRYHDSTSYRCTTQT